MSISEEVRKTLQNKPFINECVSLNIVNYNALAELLQPQIEKNLGKKCKLLSISMALRRYFNEFNSNPILSISIESDTEITIKSNLIEITIHRSHTINSTIRSLIDLLTTPENLLYTIQGTESVSILANYSLKSEIMNLLKHEQIDAVKENIGVIFLTIREIHRDIPGFFYHITRELAFNQINILSLSNINTQVLLLFYNDDLPKAFQLLYNLIGRGSDVP